jgi:hypothetical protein
VLQPVPVVEAPVSAIEVPVTSSAPRQKGHRRLTETDVRVIRQRLAAGEKGTRLAREYGLGVQTLYDIKERRTWSHVADEEMGD